MAHRAVLLPDRSGGNCCLDVVGTYREEDQGATVILLSFRRLDRSGLVGRINRRANARRDNRSPACVYFLLRSLSTEYLVPETSAEAIRPFSVIW